MNKNRKYFRIIPKLTATSIKGFLIFFFFALLTNYVGIGILQYLTASLLWKKMPCCGENDSFVSPVVKYVLFFFNLLCWVSILSSILSYISVHWVYSTLTKFLHLIYARRVRLGIFFSWKFLSICISLPQISTSRQENYRLFPFQEVDTIDVNE